MFVAVPTHLMREIEEKVAAFMEANPGLDVTEKQLRQDLLVCLDKYGRVGDIMRKEE